MTLAPTITLFHSPQTRSSGALTLLEELGAPHELRILNMKAGEQRQPAYLGINPLGKVPAILDGDALVTEQVAIFIYLADRFPQASLAPAINDPMRGPYLRWLAFYGSCFEPAIMDRYQEHAPASPAETPYGDFDSMLDVLEAQLARGPHLLGDTFSAADVLWGSALQWTMMFDLVPKRPIYLDYAERMNARPAFRRVAERDVALAAEHELAASAVRPESA